MKLKVATWNISGGVSKEVEEDKYFDQDKSIAIDTTFLNEIVKIINEKNIDIICFQEIITTESVKYIKTICDNTNLKYSKYFELSECNLVQNTNCDIAILSRYPITNTNTFTFTNPKLSKQTKSGNTYYTYDKGGMDCEINIDGKTINVITHHGFPFRRFNSTPEENLKVYKEFNDYISKYNDKIVTGDFNVGTPKSFIEELNNLKEVTDEITTVDGMKFDKIYLENKFELIDCEMIKSYSDHYLLITEVNA